MIYESVPIVVTPKTWQLTAALRWQGAVLMQAWQCLESGDVEWRSVPSESLYAAEGRDK